MRSRGKDCDMKIKIRNVERCELVSYEELPDDAVNEFDWIEESDRDNHDFFEFAGTWYCLSDFVVAPKALHPWDGTHGLTFFSGILVKIIDSSSVFAANYMN